MSTLMGREMMFFCDYGIILKKCDNVQVCACVGVGNGIKYARSGAGCFAARI